MADKYWLSNSDTDWDTAANWTGGTLPVLNDNVYFTSEGTADCTGPVTLADLGTGKIVVAKNYEGNLGTSGQSLDVDAAELTYQGSGDEAWFEGDYTTIYVKSEQTGANAFNVLANGAATVMFVAQGRANIVGSSTIVDLYVGWNKEPRRDAMVYLSDSTAISNLIRVEGGYFECAAAQAPSEGLHFEDATAKFTSQAGNLGNVYQHGGRLDYLGNGSIVGMWMTGPSLFDIGDNGRAMTIGNLKIGAGSEARCNRGGAVITFSSNVYIFGDGKFEVFQDQATVIRI